MWAAILAFLHTIVYAPLYNALILLIDYLPGHDVGVAVIILTVLVRIILFPLSRQAVESQLAMKKVGPEVEALKKKYKDDSAKQTEAIMALYKERGVHPFSSFLLLLIQLPILFALYYIFARSGLPEIDTGTLYTFIPQPAAVNMLFLGFVNMAAPHNIVLAVLVAVSQYLYTRISMGKTQDDSPVEATLSSDMAKSFDMQARYVMPGMFGVIAYILPAAAPLYYLTANIFMIAQEYLSGRRF
jgi:YidC/Oxa1 family membrane protein insertase